MPDPHEEAVEARPGIWHKDGPLAQLEAMADWADQIASQRADNLAWETAHKIARNIRAVLPHLEQERPDPECNCSALLLADSPALAQRAAIGCPVHDSQPNPPSRAGEVAEELRQRANDLRAGPMADWLRDLADKLTEQEPSDG